MELLCISLLTGISYGMVLFLIAAGLSVMLGLMGIVNLAHGAIFMTGGYVGITIGTKTGSFTLGMLAGTLAGAALGIVIERGTLRRLYMRPLEQILTTFGFVYVIANLTLWIWGPYPKFGMTPPSSRRFYSHRAGTVSYLSFGRHYCRYGNILIAMVDTRQN